MLKHMGRVAAVGLAFAVFAGAESNTTAGADQIDGKAIHLARYAKAFIGPGNVTVEVAPYHQGDQEGAILLFHGIESDWDGQAINHRVVPASYEGERYIAAYEGKEWDTLTSRKDAAGALHYEMFVPGVKEGIPLVPSDGAAQLTTPRKIFQAYQEQKRSNQ